MLTEIHKSLNWRSEIIYIFSIKVREDKVIVRKAREFKYFCFSEDYISS